MITREQCYAAYLAMGDRRSLKGLRDKLAEDGVDPPTYGTLRNWAANGRWRQRVQEHDAGIVVAVDDIREHRAEQRVSMCDAAEEAALQGFACVKEALETLKPATVEEAQIVAQIAVGLAEAATVMRREGLPGAVPILEGPYTAAQLANGEDPIAKALESLFHDPPEGS